MLVSPQNHRSQSWLVHDLASDFQVEDVWQFPIEGTSKDQFALFREVFDQAFQELSTRGIAGLLFKIRHFAGWVFRWDKDIEARHLSQIRPGSLRERLQDMNLGKAPPLRPEETAFQTVYARDREWLCEIANKTVHAGLHLGWYQDGSGLYHAEMAVYVKAKGWLGKYYMAAIKPFRRFLVYPALMKAVARVWQQRVAEV